MRDAEADMPELDRTRYVTEQYLHLQGLRLVPMGVLFLVTALVRTGWLPLPGSDRHADDWFAVGFWVAIGGSFWVRTLYEQRFGRLTPLPGHTGFRSMMAILGAVVLSAWLENIGLWPFPVPGPLLIVGVSLTYVGLAHGAVRKHYLVVALAVFSVIGMHSLGVPMRVREIWLDIVIGGGLILAGVGDDRLLRRLLQPPSETYARAV